LALRAGIGDVLSGRLSVTAARFAHTLEAKMKSPNRYSLFAKAASHFCGQPRVFSIAVGIIALWIITGPIFHFSDTWQLVINTGTTIITFLMVFLIQNTQNRDTEAIQLKLDELIRATQGAHNALLDLEELEQDTLDTFKAKYQAIAKLAREKLRKGENDVDTPEP
jgi:low affinity Fe/Cu permease